MNDVEMEETMNFWRLPFPFSTLLKTLPVEMNLYLLPDI